MIRATAEVVDRLSVAREVEQQQRALVGGDPPPDAPRVVRAQSLLGERLVPQRDVCKCAFEPFTEHHRHLAELRRTGDDTRSGGATIDVVTQDAAIERSGDVGPPIGQERRTADLRTCPVGEDTDRDPRVADREGEPGPRVCRVGFRQQYGVACSGPPHPELRGEVAREQLRRPVSDGDSLRAVKLQSSLQVDQLVDTIARDDRLESQRLAEVEEGVRLEGALHDPRLVEDGGCIDHRRVEVDAEPVGAPRAEVLTGAVLVTGKHLDLRVRAAVVVAGGEVRAVVRDRRRGR